jgi:hypothetical protein
MKKFMQQPDVSIQEEGVKPIAEQDRSYQPGKLGNSA